MAGQHPSVAAIQHPSQPDFVKLMELKGLKKAELGPLLEQTNQHKRIAKVEYAGGLRLFGIHGWMFLGGSRAKGCVACSIGLHQSWIFHG